MGYQGTLRHLMAHDMCHQMNVIDARLLHVTCKRHASITFIYDLNRIGI